MVTDDDLSNSNLPETLILALNRTKDICHEVYEVEMKNEIIDSSMNNLFESKMNTTLCEVAFEWANGKEFSYICDMTWV